MGNFQEEQAGVGFQGFCVESGEGRGMPDVD
jgi:hypothetical protein